MIQPNIKVNGKTYWQVACKHCEKADRYKVFYGGKRGFVIQCKCGHTTELENAMLQSKPNEKPTPLRNII